MVIACAAEGINWTDNISQIDFLLNMSASADVLAMAKVEIALAAIPEGKNVWCRQNSAR
jgi:hypothetical protein